MSKQLTETQKKRLQRLVELSKNGETAILEFLFDIEDRIEQELPALHNILSKIKGDKGDNYNLTETDMKKIAVQTRALINLSQLAQLAAPLVSIPVEDISRRVAKIIGTPKDGKTPSEKDLLKLIIPLIPEPVPGADGLDADDEAIYDRIVENLPSLGEAFRNGLELLEGDDRLDISAIKGWEEVVAQLKESGKTVTIGGGPRGLYMYVDGVKYGITPMLNFVAGSNVTLDFTRVNGLPTLTINATGGGGSTTYETPAGAIDNVNTVFSVTAEPKWVYYRGTIYFPGPNGYTYSAGNITMPFPPSHDGAVGEDISDQFKALIT